MKRHTSPATIAVRIGAPALLLLVASCAAQPAAESPPPAPVAAPATIGPGMGQVVETSRDGSGLRTFQVRRQGRVYRVGVQDVGSGQRRVLVSTGAPRGLEPADAPMAYEVALQAGDLIDCGGGHPMTVDPQSATYEDSSRSTVLTHGAPAYVFQGRCGA